MKRVLCIAAVIFTLSAQAQLKEGRVIYERVSQIPTRPGMDPAIAAQIPKSRTDQFELLFTTTRSLWQYLPSANEESPGTVSGPGFMMRFGGMNDVTFTNLEQGTRVDQREIMDRSYVVSDSVKKLDWKLAVETKNILTYTARKAIAHREVQRPQITVENGEMKRTIITDTVDVVAWFTTDIPVPVGPELQAQLPGAILELDINKGQTVYKATEVSPKVNVNKIREPKDGKKLTAAEFATERDKLMEEMRKNMPNGGRMRSIQIQ